ncbi:hypothetical protein ACQF1Z_004456 [Escherichia coli]|nr:hypothetical protein [Escherichia coli]EFH7907736.1 hypothetical protein [Escherichia coli O157:H7]EES1893327.1 hypothetical protein [Escherichia coli]EFE2458530.1 hypothetical protein [Escherichia coli]EFF2612269.1 hypothetical protein [Escherichia coli]
MAKFTKRIEAMILDLATDTAIDKLHQDNRAKAAALRLKRREQWERWQMAIRIKRQREAALIAFNVQVIPPKDKQGDRFNRELQNTSRNLAAMDANKRRAVAPFRRGAGF